MNYSKNKMSDYSSSEGEEDDPFQCLYETENEQEYLKQLNQEKSHGNKEGNSVFFVDESDDDEEAYTKPVITTEKKNHSFDVAKLHKCTVEELDQALCAVCFIAEENIGNHIVFCSNCNIPVHQNCYNIDVIPEQDWYCNPCGSGKDPLTLSCALCSIKGGAFSRTDDGKWIHRICALWIPNVDTLPSHEPVIYTTKHVSKGRWTVSCLLCKKKGTGAVIQCDYKKCARSVHPICMFMMPNEFHLAPDERLIFCKEHTPSSDLKPELSSSRNKKIGSSTPSAKGGKSVSSSSVHDKKKSNSAGKQSASKPHSTDEKQHTASELLHEQHSTLTIDDVNITISKINLYITDKDLVRLLFSECLIHAFASGNYRESSSIAEKTDWAIEHLLKRNEITILRTLHEYNLIDLRAHVNTSRPTLLYLAVEYDQYECCEMLLDFGVDINAYSADEGPLNSALHSAAKFGFLNILNLLCVRGANINILNHHHETPLIIACRQGHIDCVQCLLQHNANVTQKTKSGNDVFQIATRGQNSEILKLIIAASPFDFLTSSNDDNNNTNVRSPGYHDKSVRVGATSNSGRKTSSHVMSAGSSNLSSSSSSSSSSAKNDHHQQQAGKRLKY